MAKWTRELAASEVAALPDAEIDEYWAWHAEAFPKAHEQLDLIDDGLGTDAPLESSLDEADVVRLAAQLKVDRNPRATAARLRARRSHMLRKLKNRFKLYEIFTVADAAERCKVEPMEMAGFLTFESAIDGSLIVESGGRYQLISQWV